MSFRIRNILIKFILLLCFLSPLITLEAQNDSLSIEKKIRTDQPEVKNVDFRIPDESEIEKYRNDDRFDYVETKKKTELSWIDKFFRWLRDLFSSERKPQNENSQEPDFKFLYWVFAAILIAIILIVIFKFLKISPRKLFGKKKTDAPPIEIYTEDVNEMNFEKLIAKAVNEKNYRLAIRYLYLLSLKNMSDRSIIKWKPNKTNYSYQYEISNPELRSQFLDATYIFEYVWYGEFPIEQHRFEQLRSYLEQFNKMISNGK